MNQYSAGRMLFGYSMIGATVDNVKVNVTQSNGGITEIPGDISGLLTAIFSYGNTFNKLVVDAQNTDVDTLFGSCAYYGYPAGYEENKFTACTVKAKSLIGLACTDNANKTVATAAGIDGLTVTLIPDEIMAEGTLEIGKEFNVTGVALAEITSVMLGDNEFTAYSYADGTFTINAEAFGVSDAGLKPCNHG